jgi:hypothetical protein
LVTGTADKSTVAVGKPVSFSGSATTVEDGDGIAGYQWTFDDGASVPAGASVVHAFATPGLHTATVTVRDLAGVTSSARVGVTATPLDVCALAACAGCGGAATAVACPNARAVTALRIKPRAFHAARRGGITASRGGAQVTYTMLGGVSIVSFTIKRAVAGISRGAGCARRVRGLHGRRCTRYVSAAGGFSRISPAGGNGFRLTGRAGGKKLAPGRYELIAHLASAPRATGAVAQFQIVR